MQRTLSFLRSARRLPPPWSSRGGGRGGSSRDLEMHAYIHGGELSSKVSQDVGDAHCDHLARLATALFRSAHRTHVRPRASGVSLAGPHVWRDDTLAAGADEGFVLIGAVEEAVVEEEGGAVCKERVALHLAQADAAVELAPLDGLPRLRVHRALGAHLVLVGHHVPETLIIDNAKVDVKLHLAPVDARVHGLRARVGVTRSDELAAEVVRSGLTLAKLEGRCVLGGQAVESAGLGCEALDEHPHRHAGGEGMRVDDHVRGHARLGEGHVLLGPEAAEHALLAVARGELVPRDGVAVVAQLDAHLGARRAPPLCAQQPHLLHAGALGVLVVVHVVLLGHRVVRAVEGVALVKLLADVGQPVLAQALALFLHVARVCRGRVVLRDNVVERLGGRRPSAPSALLCEVDHVSGVDTRVAKAALVGCLVEYHGVLHVVARVGEHGHDRVGARGVGV
mmetsp:Transcript_2207/g.6657  ORF Transcript_2207/g.6657 Transcript_2207/m.6657 type:complete len:452 (-) Transcript_2207:1102-2457(-)